MGCICAQRRIQPGVPEGTPSYQSTQCGVVLQRPHQTEDLRRRNCCFGPEECSGRGERYQHTGVLCQNVFGDQENRRLAFYHRPECPKYIPGHSDFQDGICRIHQGFAPPGMVDLLHRSERCLFPCTSSSSLSQVHEDIFPRQGVSIQSPAFWPVPSPLAFHQGGVRGEGYGTWERYTAPPISRRLVGEGCYPGGVSKTSTRGGQVSAVSRLDREFPQIRSDSQADLRFFGNSLQPGRVQGVSHRRQPKEIEATVVSDAGWPMAHRQSVAASDWDGCLPRTSGQVRVPAHQAFPLASGLPLECPSGPSRYYGSNLRRDYEGGRLVASGGHRSSRTGGSSRSRHQDFHGCVHHRMGGSCGGHCDKGHLVTGRITPPHQHLRDESCQTSSPEPIPESRHTHTSVNGQHVCGILHQPSGGDQVHLSLERDHPVIPNATGPQHISEGSSHSGTVECNSGHVVQGRTDPPHRMVPEPEGGRGSVSGMGHSTDRSVCHQVQPEVPGVCVPSPGPSSFRHRRSSSGMESPVGVCLSPTTDCGQGAPEDSSVALQDHSYSISLGPAVILSRPAGTVGEASVQAPLASRPAQSAVDRSSPSPTRAPAASRLASEHRALAARGFSKEAADRIAAPQAKSTLGIYEGKWKVFMGWCKGREIDPFSASTPGIADFLLYLFKDRKLRPSTIAGYRTAIAGALKVSQGVDYGKDERLSSLVLSFFREQPRQVRSYPAWDLGLVLQVLPKAPFEPLQMADLKYVTWKTAFLVLLATGSRRGEVHALDYSKVRPEEKWAHIILEPHASFVAKTELRKSGASVLSPVKIPALGPMLGPGQEEDRGLCPVRALKVYIAKTKDLREGKQLLFVSYKAGHKGDIHKNTISSWIRKLLYFSYSKATEDVIRLSSARTHEVRALASSMAFRGSIELEEVLRACTWKNSNTFTTHYLRDVSSFAGTLHSLGPIVAAQKVVHPSGSI